MQGDDLHTLDPTELAQLDKDVGPQVALMQDLEQLFRGMAQRIESGEVVTEEQMAIEADAVAERHGCHYGLPLPTLTGDGEETHWNEMPMDLASGVPLEALVRANQRLSDRRDEAQTPAADRKLNVRNRWTSLIRNEQVFLLDLPGKTAPVVCTESLVGSRLQFMIQTLEANHGAPHKSAEAELKALELLRTKINESQFRCYMLSNIFPERSPRSDLTYFFRKGLPILCTSWHSDKEGKIIACLCFHPMGYYEGSHAGLMCPTDEVIAQLLMMRADEHRLWRYSGQWHTWDPQAGV